MDADPSIVICYRQAQPEDLAVCYGIKTRSIKPYVSAVWGWNEGFQKAFHEGSFKPEATRILYLGERVVGYVEVEYREEEIFLSNILIDEAFQGRGVGTWVLQQLIAEAAGGPVADERGLPELPAAGTGAATGDSRTEDGRTEDRTRGASGKRRPIRLEVFRINTGARRFYERLGFRVIERDRIKYVMVRK